MTIQQYKKIKLVVVVLIAMVFSQSIVMKNYVVPIFLLAFSSLFLLYIRKKVKGVLADERDYLVAGKASLLAVQIYSWLGVIAMFILYANRDLNPFYEPIAITISFSVTLLLLLYSFIFRYYNKIKFSDKGLVYTFIILLIFIAMAITSVRLFSGEDDWICQNGEWVKHGNPSFSAPTTECK